MGGLVGLEGGRGGFLEDDCGVVVVLGKKVDGLWGGEVSTAETLDS